MYTELIRVNIELCVLFRYHIYIYIQVMFLINTNDILYVRTIHSDILSKSCIDKICISGIDNDTFSIPDIENLSLPHIDKIISVYT